MSIERRTFLGSLAGMLAASAARAEPTTPFAGDLGAPPWPPKERFPLWPGKPPGAPAQAIAPNWTMNGGQGARELWIRGVPFPEVNVFRPARPDGSGLLVLPGGGYEFLSVQNEGFDAARRFNAGGTTVFVLTYRLPAEGWADRALVPLQDAQRAMRLIRSRAAKLGVEADRVGVLGFSAGGHLAADLAVNSGSRTYRQVDAADRLSARPAYAGLVYPVVSMIAGEGGGRSMDALTGLDPAGGLLAARSPLRRVGKDTPPSFLVHAVDDGTVPVENSNAWLAACRAAGVKCEAHIFDEGGHGFGFHLPPELPGSRWPDLFALWLRRNGG